MASYALFQIIFDSYRASRGVLFIVVSPAI